MTTELESEELRLLEESGILHLLMLRLYLRKVTLKDVKCTTEIACYPIGYIFVCEDGTKMSLFDIVGTRHRATRINYDAIEYIDIGGNEKEIIAAYETALAKGLINEEDVLLWDKAFNPDDTSTDIWCSCATHKYAFLLELVIKHGGVSLEKTIELLNNSIT
jgi:hypothetical protein